MRPRPRRNVLPEAHNNIKSWHHRSKTAMAVALIGMRRMGEAAAMWEKSE